MFLERHSMLAQPRTIQSLRERLKRPLEAYGSTPLVELEHMTDELAGFAAKLPDRYRYSSCPLCGRRWPQESATAT